MMEKFSRDGVNVIPNLFPNLERSDALDFTLHTFNEFLKYLEHTPVENASVAISKDDKSIIEYIGGYILQKLKNRQKLMMNIIR